MARGSTERIQCKGALRAILGDGIKLSNELEPADALIDLALDIHEAEQVKRIDWESCTSKNDETDSEKKCKDLRVDKDGVLRVGQSVSEVVADASTILKLGDALTRRGAALHIAKVLS